MGLVSDGGVHSDVEHLLALIDAAADAGVPATSHAFTDGRDTAPEIADRFLADVTAKADERGTGHVATVTGRYHAMDRDENWERTKKAYDAIVEREALHEAETAVEAATEAHARGETDEFIERRRWSPAPPPRRRRRGRLQLQGRSRPATGRMLTDTRPDWTFDLDQPGIRMTTMTEYDETFAFPVAFPPQMPANTIGEVVSEAGLTQLRIAESEKYPHVTYFLNGGREVESPRRRAARDRRKSGRADVRPPAGDVRAGAYGRGGRDHH